MTRLLHSSIHGSYLEGCLDNWSEPVVVRSVFGILKLHLKYGHLKMVMLQCFRIMNFTFDIRGRRLISRRTKMYTISKG